MAPEPKEEPAAEGVGKSFARRDLLLSIERIVQRRWEEAEVFRADSRPGGAPSPDEKFFGNFPYPYMNGSLHLGHAFSLSKLEFAAAFHRLCGRNVLLPFAFHCTGMPIKASADKLARELRRFGNPPVFPSSDPIDEEVEGDEKKPDDAAANGQAAPDKFKSKRSKAAAKSGGDKYQWEIMRSFGLSDAEIAKFQDPYHWLSHFPPLAREDLKTFGLGCDWRRSFITTDMNPFYDSFVRWQLRKLKEMGKIVKDMRYTIYSPLDGQPCADHDRASGEGVQPQDYVLIKMEVIPPFAGKMKVLEGKRVFLGAATLRPETMYGQTNCWVLPDGKYGAFEINDTEVFVLTERSALNLAYQNLSRVPEKPTCLAEFSGNDLIGLPLSSPLSFNKVIYALPMLTILTDKGTGIVTSVPSDSPDDYMALHDLKAKPALRTKYGVKDEWVLPFDVIPIINIPEFGDKAAEKVCIDLKIRSQNDKDKLAEAKRLTYLRGFNEGTMLIGEFKGVKVQEAKPLIRTALLGKGQAVMYSEPEKRVTSRSGDECVVALTDQWYITYGEEEWKKKAEDCLSNMNLYCDETRHGFEHTLSWLNQWACSRSFGLGTRIPWDEQFLVESLSDSTLYMAFYTVAHILQNGDMYGTDFSSVKPDQMTDEVWDYVFGGGPYPKADISPSQLNMMKQEFTYWYPFNLRVSGKDLIQNHLTFCIYNHTALLPEHQWPLGFRCNGHIMLNSEKMSKSTGNFKTLRQSIEEYSADATRFALADSGDGMDDANFVTDTANAAILRLTKELAWMEEMLADPEAKLRKDPPFTYADRVFANEINIAVKLAKQHYSDYMFREALKVGFYDLQTARDEYRLSCLVGGMNRDLLCRFMDVQTRLLAPICPHYAEHVWKDILRKDGFVVNTGWPVADAPDLTLKRANKYLQDTIVLMRKLKEKQEVGPKKTKKGTPAPPALEKKLAVGLVYVNEQYDGWKEGCLRILRNKYDQDRGCFAPDVEILEALKELEIENKPFKQLQRECMPFLKFKKDEVRSVGLHALDLKLPFGEMDVLMENADLIKRQLQLDHLEILSYKDETALQKAGPYIEILKQNRPSPGDPVSIFLSSSEYPVVQGGGN